MTELALSNYEKAEAQRLGRNDARRIRSERDKARSPTSGAGRRWPFELLQNAHDPGPRAGSRFVDIRFCTKDSVLVFQHNGRPFSMEDLAALLTGGSNKDYESVETSGRFGTGFLVTHALSPFITLAGVVVNDSIHERFEIHLDRSGDEPAIQQNAQSAKQEIGAAQAIPKLDGPWTAEFKYPIDGSREALDIGIESVRRSAPYLFGTCYQLGCLTIETDDDIVASWSPSEIRRSKREGIEIQERDIAFKSADDSQFYRILRLVPEHCGDVGLLILLRLNGERWEFVAPQSELPRVFSRMPVRASTFLSINFVIDGHFEVQEERDRIAMNESDKAKIEGAFQLISKAISFGVADGWEQCHRLAKFTKIESAFSEAAQVSELDWWNSQLHNVAAQVARLPLVETSIGYLPASVSEDQYADFVLPRYSVASHKDELPELRFWKAAADTTVLDPPTDARSAEWNELSLGWQELEVPVSRMGLKEIGEQVRDGVARLSELPTKIEPRLWLAHYFDLLGELPSGHDCSQLASGLIPNQRGDLCSVATLKRDSGIPEALKDIAESIGCKIREYLVDKELMQLADLENYRFLKAFLHKIIPTEMSEQEVIETCLRRLSDELPDGQQLKKGAIGLVEASVSLIRFLWTTRSEGASLLAQRCPLLASDDSIAHFTSKKIMAPVGAWHEQSRAFAEIYPPSRVLANIYVDPSASDQSIVDALERWGIVFRDPLYVGRRNEIDDALLRGLADVGSDIQGVVVRDEDFSQVALLGTEVIQRCQEEERLAALLLGFTLKYLAPIDPAWRRRRTVMGRRAGKELPLTVREALWVADLKRRAWVPMKGDGGNEKVEPSPASLSLLLREEWIVDNDAAIEFLVQCFGFEVLSLRLLALPSEMKLQISSRLAELVQLGGDNAQFYEQIVVGIEAQRQRQREKERNRNFGLAVQDAIEKYLSNCGLTVKVIDRGYDFDVEPSEGLPSIEAGTHELSVGPYLVEVKATTSGYVRLTPAQARVSSTSDQFVLCVVDLRGCSPQRLEEPWTAEDVQPFARITTSIRPTMNATHSLVQAAIEQEITLQNDSKLRYVVPPDIWQNGSQIELWVQTIVPTINSSN